MSAAAECRKPVPRLPTEDDLPYDDAGRAAVRLPTEDDLPYEDGVPMETLRHRLQMELLIHTLEPWAAARGDCFVSGNQFVYFSAEQLRGRDFRGPDVFVVCGVSRRERKSWVVWEEGKGPDVVIELLSERTASFDKGGKKAIYQNGLRVPEYFWIDPFETEDRAGFALIDGVYRELSRDGAGCLPVDTLGLKLCLWHGEYLGVEADWLRWADDRGLLPLPEESERRRAEAERARADFERERAEAERLRAERECERAETERARAEAALAELARLRAELARGAGGGA